MLCLQVDRVIKMAKAARTEMVQLSSGDLEFEEQVDNSNQKPWINIDHYPYYVGNANLAYTMTFLIKVINFFELRDNLAEYLDLLNNCDSEESQEGKVRLTLFMLFVFLKKAAI